jgi:uncharacterized membrane protein
MLAYVGTTKVSTLCCPRWRKILKSKFVGTSSMQSHAVWSSQTAGCVISATNSFRWSLLVNILVDLSLLCIMFAGVLQKKNATHLWRMLYFQSIFWILTAISTEVPSVVSHRHNAFFEPLFTLLFFQGPQFYERERCVKAYDSPLMSLLSLVRYIRCMEFGE